VSVMPAKHHRTYTTRSDASGQHNSCTAANVNDNVTKYPTDARHMEDAQHCGCLLDSMHGGMTTVSEYRLRLCMQIVGKVLADFWLVRTYRADKHAAN
jgi:hypothetical protein